MTTAKTIVRGAAAFGLAALVSFAIVAYGQGLWQPLVIANIKFHPEIPWAAPTMAVLLAGLLAYLSGRGWPRATSERRRELFRWNRMPWSTFFLAVGAGVLGLAAFGGLWIAAADLVHIPAGVQPKLGHIPLPTAISFLVMSALAAPLSEEAAFRGYAMGILQKAWGHAPAAIVGSTLLFAAVHFVQGIDAVKLSLYFGAGLIFALLGYMTNSLYAAMAVHSLGDVLGFTVLWPHDQIPHAMGFADPLFAPALAALAVFAPLTVLAFRKLHAVSRPLRAAPPPRALGALPVAA
ncbi:MAG TPA: type II CAAX endopeptidase family protein [Phenylobacterium sp.]|jgi:membrane protease YdiL (CAAX protease family)|uniref:CPBP family intramembrane glutamic endopeptidase n=1 Tax=Phenylobacterium sp. TaxID=1871053 RepID=UPI002B7B709F|nr:type II CAAX endopeptidase family protein [Phenylobacterium sp.]HXA41082.1 type II CAAX endopeptidase family protein [Phenylobacterium sp.]